MALGADGGPRVGQWRLARQIDLPTERATPSSCRSWTTRSERAWKTLEVDQHAEFDALTTRVAGAQLQRRLRMELPSADGTKNRVPGDTPVTVEIPECRWGL